MKHKSVWIKVLLLALCLTFVFSGLVGCGNDDEIEALKQQLEITKDKLDDLADKAETKDNVAELRTLVEAIKATADSAVTAAKLQEAIDALAATVNGKADPAAIAAAVEAAKTELNALIAANGEADATVKAALNNAIAALNGDVDELTEALAAAKTALEKADAENKAALEAAVKAQKEALAEAVDNLGKDIAAVKDELEAKIDELEAKYEELADLNGFKAAYDKATDLLWGFDYDIEDKAPDHDDFDTYEEYMDAVMAILEEAVAAYPYSMAALEIRSMLVDRESMFYEEDAYNAFMVEVERIAFYMERALSEEALKALIDVDYANAVAELEKHDYRDNFQALLDSYKGTLTLDSDYELVEFVYQIIIVDEELTEEEVAAYEKDFSELTAAWWILHYYNDLADAIEIPEDILYMDSDEAVAAARKALTDLQADYDEAYKAEENADVAAWIDPAYKISDMMDYASLVAAEERVIELKAAFAAMSDKLLFVDEILLYAEERPLYTDLKAIADNKADIDAWIAEFHLDADNIVALYNAYGMAQDLPVAGYGFSYDLVALAYNYAAAMDALYTEYLNTAAAAYGDVTLPAALATLADKAAAKTFVYKTDAAIYKAIDTALVDLLADVVAVDGYEAALDGNYLAMTDALAEDKNATIAIIADFDELIKDLAEQKDILDAIIAVKDENGNIIATFNHSAILSHCRSLLDNQYKALGIVAGDANYNDLCAATEASYEAVKAAYDILTAEIVVIYENATKLLADLKATMALADGNKLIDALEDLRTIVVEKELTLVFLKLTSGDKDVNIADLYEQFNAVAREFNDKAAKADAGADDVEALINALLYADVKSTVAAAKNLNNSIYVDAAVDALFAWYKAYINKDFALKTAIDGYTAADFEAVRVALEAIVDIEIFDDNDTKEIYSFVSVVKLNSLELVYNSFVASYAAAKADAAALKEAMAKLDAVGEWNIHSDFATVQTAYVALCNTYFGGTIIVDICEVLDAYNLFNAQREDYLKLYAEAQEIADMINALIEALADGAIDPAQAAAVLADIDVIDGLFEQYLAKAQCEEICTECVKSFFTVDGVDNWLVFNRTKAQAEFAAEYADVFAAAEAEDQAKLATDKTTIDNLFANATTVGQIKVIAGMAANKLESYR